MVQKLWPFQDWKYAKRGGVSYNVPLDALFFAFGKAHSKSNIWIIHVQATWLVNPSTLIVDQKWHWQVVVKLNRAIKLNIQAIFRGGLLCRYRDWPKVYLITYSWTNYFTETLKKIRYYIANLIYIIWWITIKFKNIIQFHSFNYL